MLKYFLFGPLEKRSARPWSGATLLCAQRGEEPGCGLRPAETRRFLRDTAAAAPGARCPVEMQCECTDPLEVSSVHIKKVKRNR